MAQWAIDKNASSDPVEREIGRRSIRLLMNKHFEVTKADLEVLKIAAARSAAAPALIAANDSLTETTADDVVEVAEEKPRLPTSPRRFHRIAQRIRAD